MRLVITGVGMVTSLGYGAQGSLAAIRAGLSRPTALDGFEVDGGDGEMALAVGYPVSNFAEGFFQTGAWVRLGVGALDDLIHRSGLPPASARDFWLRTGLIALAPIIDVKRFHWSLDQIPDALLDFYAKPVVDLARLSLLPNQIQPLALGHCGLAHALAHTREHLRSGRLDRVILLGTDSYLDPMSIAWLSEQCRLKTPAVATGIMPGEAGACVLVESDLAAKRRGATVGASVGAVAMDQVPFSGPRSVPMLARAIASILEQLLPGFSKTTPFRGELLLDLNGEDWKARAWGTAQTLLTDRIDFDGCRLTTSSEVLGEVGAASGPIAAALAVQSFLRQDDPNGRALICSLSDAGHVSAFLLNRTQRPLGCTAAGTAMSR